MNEAFKRKYSSCITEAIDESDKEQLRNDLVMKSMDVIYSGGSIKQLEIALQDVIRKFYPDHDWWEVTDCQIYNELLAGVKPREVCDMIVDQLKPEFTGNAEESISKNNESKPINEDAKGTGRAVLKTFIKNEDISISDDVDSEVQ